MGICYSRFTNEYGEDWIFEYDYSTGTGLLKGSDIDWNSYPVIKGCAIGLNLIKSELAWMRICWREAIGDLSEPKTSW